MRKSAHASKRRRDYATLHPSRDSEKQARLLFASISCALRRLNNVCSSVASPAYDLPGRSEGASAWPLAMIPLKAISIIGSYAGNLVQLQQLMNFVGAGRPSP